MCRWIKMIPAVIVFTGTAIFMIPDSASAKLEVGAGLSLAWPQGNFKEEVDFAWGGGARAGWGFNEQAAGGATLFFDLSYLNYGRERRVEPFSYTIPDVEVDVYTDNFMVLASPGVWVGLRKGWIRPYGELFGGLTYIATTTKIENRGIFGEQIASSTNLSDWTYNIGFGGGVQVLLWRKPAGSSLPIKTTLSEALLDIKFSYIKGGEAVYLKKGSISSAGNGRVNYDTIESETTLFQARIGATFRF
jgi:hypothetical protein